MKSKTAKRCFHIVTAALAAALAFSVSAATEYTWTLNAADSGSWTDPAKWGGSGYPSTGDTANINCYATTMSFDQDIDIAVMNWKWGSPNKAIFLLGGHTLELTKSGYNTYFKGPAPTSAWQLDATRGHWFENGTFKVNRPIIGDSNGSCGYLHFDSVAFEGTFWEWPTASRVVLTNSSSWKFDQSLTIGPGVYRAPAANGFAAAFGSTIDAADCDLNICISETGLWLAESSAATISNLWIGSSWRATNTTVRVEDSTLTLNGDLTLGSAVTNPDGPTAAYRSEDNRTKGATLKISGDSSVDVAGAVNVYESTEALFEFSVPAAGYSQTPLTAGSLALVARDAGDEEFGPTALRVNCYDWAKTRSAATMTLIKLDASAGEALMAIAAMVEWPDFPPVGMLPTASVSDDGTELRITSPEFNYDPLFTVEMKSGAAVGKKTLGLNLVDYGFEASSIVLAECRIADNAQFQNPIGMQLLIDETITGALPISRDFVLDGPFVEWKRYYGRLTITNDRGRAADFDFEFDGDAVAETLYWQQGQSTYDGTWQDATKWYVNSVCENQFPHAEDIVQLANPNSDYTITFTDDADISRFYVGSAKFPAFSYGTKTFDLDGCTLTMHSTYSEANQCVCIGGSYTLPTDWSFDVLKPALVINRGTFINTQASPSRILIGAINAESSGSLVLRGETTLKIPVQYLQNSSRFLVTEGSYYESDVNDLTLNGHTARRPYCTFCVKDSGSRANLKTRNLAVAGDRAGAFIIDGGQLDCADVRIGESMMWDASSSPLSEITLVKVANGTVNATGDLKFGYTRNGLGTKVNNQYPPFDVAQNPQFIVGGTNTAVAIDGAIDILEEFDSVLEFQLEPQGFKATPVTANSLVITPRPTDDLKSARGLAKLVLSGTREWVRRNHGRSMTLLKLNTDCTAALTTLKSRLVSDSSKITGDNLSISQDGTELVLTAPAGVGSVLVFE